GSLVEQWRDELFEKFGLEFHVYSSLLEQTSPSGNPFDDYPRLIVRLDQLSRNEELQVKLCARFADLALDVGLLLTKCCECAIKHAGRSIFQKEADGRALWNL